MTASQNTGRSVAIRMVLRKERWLRNANGVYQRSLHMTERATRQLLARLVGWMMLTNGNVVTLTNQRLLDVTNWSCDTLGQQSVDYYLPTAGDRQPARPVSSDGR